ncbi:bifunctional folylpolyglutamate synthase/dihydrofolate synthase [Thermodesulfatator atlanticus]|uniref:bifunctional folylpolyglutamate synthase/dihydrofolate synthase n=1 Tax=Thermodesulfatator atlanticus TaxID=501497 RepID=UPI0003B73F38|nr:folylpolyglutamate synthase/dihydrofolate synthase family protein [Thermodesulfatator atlanticus]
MEFNEAKNWLSGFQFHGIKPGLSRINKLLASLGHPEKNYPCVHLAGTNGKGSTAAFLESILRAHGLKTGLYTSPHLVSVCERFKINGKNLSEEKFAKYCTDVKEVLGTGEATYFELTTAIAFWAFSQEKIDIAIIECGLGGRLDATNVITPALSIITPISYDHMAYLGETLSQIAREKAGIIKPGIPVVLAPQREEAREVILKSARQKKAPVYQYGRDFRCKPLTKDTHRYEGAHVFEGLVLSLRGEYQVENMALAIKAAEILEEKGFLRLSEEKLKKALSTTFWPCRFEFLPFEPPVILDAAHNEEGINLLLKNLSQAGIEKFILLFAASNEGGTKPFYKMLEKIMPKAAKIFICEPPGPRAPVTIEEWKKALNSNENISYYKSWEEALLAARKSQGKLPLVVAGSLYLAGRVRNALADNLNICDGDQSFVD